MQYHTDKILLACRAAHVSWSKESGMRKLSGTNHPLCALPMMAQWTIWKMGEG